METRYIAFLRGVNVGGRVVKMERLRGLFSEMGFTHVRSYIQSGNVFFETTETNPAALTRKIEQRLLDALGYQVSTFLRTLPQVERALQLDPFQQVEVTPDTRLFLLFISEPLPSDLALPFRSPRNDFEIVQATPSEVFVVSRLMNGKPGNPVAVIEKTFQVKTTSRFFGTALKILQAAKSA